VTRLQLLALAQDGIDQRSTGMETWLIDPLDGPQVALLNVPAWQPLRTPGEAAAFVERVRAMGPYSRRTWRTSSAGTRPACRRRPIR